MLAFRQRQKSCLRGPLLFNPGKQNKIKRKFNWTGMLIFAITPPYKMGESLLKQMNSINTNKKKS